MGSVVLSIEGAMELLTLMAILSSVNGNHWHQFPLPYVNYYHIPTVFSRSFSITPLASNQDIQFFPKLSKILLSTTSTQTLATQQIKALHLLDQKTPSLFKEWFLLTSLPQGI